MALARYRALVGHVSHPTKRAHFVGWERLVGADPKAEFIVPDGFRYRKLPDGEVIQDSAMLRVACTDGALERLPLELAPAKKVKEASNG